MISPTPEVVIGLDFGSSNCSVSYYHEGSIKSLYLGGDSTVKTCPTSMYIDKKIDRLVVSQIPANSDYSADHFYITGLKERLITKEPIYYKGSELSLTHLISQIYLNLKRELELKLCTQIKKAVITVPAYFGEEPRHILKDAAKIADLEVLRIINEPTAAALWYSTQYKAVQDTYLFVDIGGLTIDMSICNLMNGVLDVVSTYGNTSAGHGFIDKLIYYKLLGQIKSIHPVLYQKIESKEINLQLLDVAESLKKTFSDSSSSQIFFHQEITSDEITELCHFEFTKVELYAIYNQFMVKIRQIYQETLRRSGLDVKNLSKVILIGGPASSALLRKLVESTIPIPQAEHFDNISSVSKGAALYGSELLGKSCNIVLSDVLPISIGVELENGVVEKALPSNIKLPNCVIKEFTTTEDYQNTVRVSIYEGERLLSKDCVKLGEINLSGIELGLRGHPIIKVILEITQEGVINGYVLDQKTKKEAQVTITSRSRSTPAQILLLKEQAMKYREADLAHLQILNLNTEIRNLSKKLAVVKPTIKCNTLTESCYFLESKIHKVLEFSYKKKPILVDLKEDIIEFLKKVQLYILDQSAISKI